MADVFDNYFCFNGFPCREVRCKAYDKTLKECLFVAAARSTVEANKKKPVEKISEPVTKEPVKSTPTTEKKAPRKKAEMTK